jgi:hypothetical protein
VAFWQLQASRKNEINSTWEYSGNDDAARPALVLKRLLEENISR